MKERKRNGSKLFLTELMISIFFFAIVVAICIQLFSDSFIMSKDSKRLTEAVNITSNFAEYYYVWDGEADSLIGAFPTGSFEGDSFVVNYDKSFEAVPYKEKYYMKADFYKEDIIETVVISFNFDDGEEIYRLKVERLSHE